MTFGWAHWDLEARWRSGSADEAQSPKPAAGEIKGVGEI